MKIASNDAYEMIKKWEGCRLTAYKCPSGVWTIGYGHTSGVGEGDTITQEQAERYLVSDVHRFENYVNRYDPYYDFTQSQFDALVSFTFNCGNGNLIKLVSGGSKPIKQVAEDMLLYINSNGKPLKGLENRRRDEYALFNKDGAVAPAINYYPRYTGNSPAIDVVFAWVGADVDYNHSAKYKWQKRIPIASANGIDNYTGTYEQNVSLIALAKEGKLKCV